MPLHRFLHTYLPGRIVVFAPIGLSINPQQTRYAHQSPKQKSSLKGAPAAGTAGQQEAFGFGGRIESVPRGAQVLKYELVFEKDYIAFSASAAASWP